MEPSTVGMEIRGTLTPEAEEFVRQWQSSASYITARTSGSTGEPKEIHLLKEDMRRSAAATNRYFGITPQSTLLLPLSPDYIAGKMQIVRCIEAKCAILCEHPSNHPFAKTEIPEATMIPIVPSQIEGFLESAIAQKVANVIVGGAPVSAAQEQLLSGLRGNAFATYGMTETCSHVALRRIGQPEFTPLPGFSFSTDHRRCLVIDSATLSFRHLVTNDMVRLCPSGGFVWLGRWDNVINSGGLKIFPEEIEAKLMPLLPPDRHAYVTGRQSDKWGTEAVIVTDWAELTIPMLRSLDIPHSRMLKDIIYRDTLPFTGSGKIIRHLLLCHEDNK